MCNAAAIPIFIISGDEGNPDWTLEWKIRNLAYLEN